MKTVVIDLDFYGRHRLRDEPGPTIEEMTEWAQSYPEYLREYEVWSSRHFWNSHQVTIPEEVWNKLELAYQMEAEVNDYLSALSDSLDRKFCEDNPRPEVVYPQGQRPQTTNAISSTHSSNGDLIK